MATTKKTTPTEIATFTVNYVTVVCEVICGKSLFGEPQTVITCTITDNSIGLKLGRVKRVFGRDEKGSSYDAASLLEHYTDQYLDVIEAYNGLRALRREMPRRYARRVFRGIAKSRLFN